MFQLCSFDSLAQRKSTVYVENSMKKPRISARLKERLLKLEDHFMFVLDMDLIFLRVMARMRATLLCAMLPTFSAVLAMRS